MAKRGQPAKTNKNGTEDGGSALATRQYHPPKKRPVMLALSALLFAAWFVFLLLTALGILFAEGTQMR